MSSQIMWKEHQTNCLLLVVARQSLSGLMAIHHCCAFVYGEGSTYRWDFCVDGTVPIPPEAAIAYKIQFKNEILVWMVLGTLQPWCGICWALTDIVSWFQVFCDPAWIQTTKTTEAFAYRKFCMMSHLMLTAKRARIISQLGPLSTSRILSALRSVLPV